MNKHNTISVTSHVGRDLLSSAASFRNDAATIWEYVVNSLQYVDHHINPIIQVTIKNKAKIIEISDNGQGMDVNDLNNFFTMHGENFERLSGRPGRGKFGTGKSAAFGIGKLLRVDSIKNGVRNVIELHRDDIETSKGDDIPVNWVIKNEGIDADNGTIIIISEIFLQNINTTSIIEYIERNLPIFRAKQPEVAVNEHLCEYKEPNIIDKYEFKTSEKQRELLGDILLTIKMSPTPLAKIEQGVSISAGFGNLVAIETGGIENKELGNYLFGEVDVPMLETFDTPIEPYNSTRSMELNILHPVAQALVTFIGANLEKVRRIHLKSLNEARKTEQSRRLAKEANKIAELLNSDFQQVMNKLDHIRSVSSKIGSIDADFGSASSGGTNEDAWIEGIQTPGNIATPSNVQPEVISDNNDQQPPREDPVIPAEGHPEDNGNSSVDPAGGKTTKRKKPRGGFSVEYRNLGKDSDRSKYDKTTLTILINLDHPAVSNALNNSAVEDVNFRRLSYEIAFSEYSIAFGYALADDDPDIPADDLLFDVRSTLNRISTSAASLYA